MKTLSAVLFSSMGLLLACSNAVASEEIPDAVASPQYDFNTALGRQRSKPDQAFKDFCAERTQLFKKTKEPSEKKQSKAVEKVNPATGIWYKPTRWNQQTWQGATWEPEDDFVVEEKVDLEQQKRDALKVLAAVIQTPQSETETRPSPLQAGHAEFFLKYSESFAKKQTFEQVRCAAGYTQLIIQNPNSPYYKAPKKEDTETEEPNKITFGQDGQNGYIEYFVEGEKAAASSWFSSFFGS